MRNPGLDLGRVYAAGIVYLGHLFFLTPILAVSPCLGYALTPLHTGATAVLFFFSLSGYVLASQLGDRIPSLYWPLARYVRLIPVYYVAFFIPLFYGVFFHNDKIDVKGIIVGFTAVQSQFSEYALQVNAPLWSISAELLLSLFVFVVYKTKFRSIWYLLGLGIVVLSGSKLGQNPVIYGIPYFLLGVWLNGKRFVFEYRLSGRHNLKLALISYLAVSPLLIISGSFQAKTVLNLLFFTWIILLLRSAKVPNWQSRIADFGGKRSYAFYAIHFPIVEFFLNFTNPVTFASLFLYVLLTTTITILLSELVFRTVDLPAVNLSRRFRKFK